MKLKKEKKFQESPERGGDSGRIRCDLLRGVLIWSTAAFSTGTSNWIGDAFENSGVVSDILKVAVCNSSAWSVCLLKCLTDVSWSIFSVVLILKWIYNIDFQQIQTIKKFITLQTIFVVVVVVWISDCFCLKKTCNQKI